MPPYRIHSLRSTAVVLPLVCTLLASLLACAAQEDGSTREGETTTIQAELDDVQAELNCYVGPKQPGKAPCPLAARTPERSCLSAVGWRVSELQLTEGLAPESAEGMGSTPDGGFFQYLHRAHGITGVYCHPQRTRARAQLVHGAIHELWAGHGYEAWAEVGYPVTDEHDAHGACAAKGAVRQQEFEPVPVDNVPGFTHLLTFLCWSPHQGAWLEKVPGSTSYRPL